MVRDSFSVRLLFYLLVVLPWACLCRPCPLLEPRTVLLGLVCSAPFLWYATTLRHVYEVDVISCSASLLPPVYVVIFEVI